MKLLATLERKLGRFAIPDITLYIIIGQVVIYGLSVTNESFLQQIDYIPALLLKGEIWRVFTFIFTPPTTHVFFAFFAWYIFYMMGSSLERTWGAFRYNMFLLIGYIATVLVSFIFPTEPATTAFLGVSVFLAFAYLNPTFELCILFILPVKIRWLAMFTWASYAFVLLAGPWPHKLLTLASLSNYFLFFGKEIAHNAKAGHDRMQQQVKAADSPANDDPFCHLCTVCGASDKTEPKKDFRYCTKCKPVKCYCDEHIRNHEHANEAGTDSEEVSTL